MKKLTTEEFIEKAQTRHGEMYDYSGCAYKNFGTPVEIVCKTHGVFSQKPDHKVVVNGTRRHKSGFTLDNLRKRLGEKFDSSLTERENCRNNSLYRVYNCGLTKWLWTNT